MRLFPFFYVFSLFASPVAAQEVLPPFSVGGQEAIPGASIAPQLLLPLGQFGVLAGAGAGLTPQYAGAGNGFGFTGNAGLRWRIPSGFGLFLDASAGSSSGIAKRVLTDNQSANGPLLVSSHTVANSLTSISLASVSVGPSWTFADFLTLKVGGGLGRADVRTRVSAATDWTATYGSRTVSRGNAARSYLLDAPSNAPLATAGAEVDILAVLRLAGVGVTSRYGLLLNLDGAVGRFDAPAPPGSLSTKRLLGMATTSLSWLAWF